MSQVVTINPEMFTCAKKDEDFSNILHNAQMVIPDGVGVKIGLKILKLMMSMKRELPSI